MVRVDPHTRMGVIIVIHLFRRLKALGIAVVVLALSASLAFGAQPQSGGAWGRANAAQHSGKTVPVVTVGENGDEGDEDVEEAGDDESVDESTDEETTEDETTEDETTEDGSADEDGGDHCAVDPTLLTEEELAAMNHGAIVCWAAHQTEWPAEFKNHGAWVSSWAHAGKDHGPDAAKGKGKNKNKSGSGD